MKKVVVRRSRGLHYHRRPGFVLRRLQRQGWAAMGCRVEVRVVGKQELEMRGATTWGLMVDLGLGHGPALWAFWSSMAVGFFFHLYEYFPSQKKYDYFPSKNVYGYFYC